MKRTIPPPTKTEWDRLPRLVRWKIFLLVWWNVGLAKPALPLPVHFGILFALCEFAIMPIAPSHPMSIPVVIGGGLAGALLLVGRSHGRISNS